MGVERLYYTDSYLTDFHAAVVARGDGGRRFYRDRTAFYPTSGGQPNDLGTIGSVPVVDVIDEEERIAHILAAPLDAAEVECRIDWTRRFDHMQQHTGQHLLSAVLVDLYGAATVGFHLGAESSQIDVAGALTEAQIVEAELRANRVVFENRPVAVSFEEAVEVEGLRKPSSRQGRLRIVSIADLDRSACGGTHVRVTGEIGPILLRKLDRAHGALRIEFLCGARAIARARADYDALSRAARALSASLDEVPTLASTQAEALAAADKARRKLATELAALRGREQYAGTVPNASGVRFHELSIERGALDDETRAFAQGFTSGSRSCLLALAADPPAVLLAASDDSGLHAGNLLKQAVSALGGRGGGNARLAQGSVPSREALEALAAELRRLA